MAQDVYFVAHIGFVASVCSPIGVWMERQGVNTEQKKKKNEKQLEDQQGNKRTSILLTWASTCFFNSASRASRAARAASTLRLRSGAISCWSC